MAEETIIWGDYYLAKTGKVTHDGQPIYHAGSLHLFGDLVDNDWVFVDGVPVSYDAETQTYAVVAGKAKPAEE